MKTSVLTLLAASAAAAAAAAPARKPPAKPAPAKAPLRITGPMTFSPKVLDLAPGETFLAELMVPSPTGHAFTGDLTLHPGAGVTAQPTKRFPGRVPPWGVKAYLKVSAAPTASGDILLEASLGTAAKATLTVRVAPPQVEVIPGQGELTVRVSSPFGSRLMRGGVKVSNRDRFLQDRTTHVFEIKPGGTQDLVFPLPGAAPAESETYDFTVEVSTYHGYRERKTYPLSFPPQSAK
jgi:hypothetical protein